MSFPRYPRYKPSGVDWLGEVPEHWGVKPLCALFRRVKRTDQPDEQLLSVYRDLGVVPKSSRDDNFNKPSDDLSQYQLVEPGDLVINKMKAWQGSVAVSDFRGIVSPAYFTYVSIHNECGRYLHYLMRSLPYIDCYQTISKGIRINQWDLEPEAHRRMPLLLPRPSEQRAIAAFLDRETAKIDSLIAEQERLIELLAEKRQAVISHAVTKGLNPAAPMKPSGVEWLGDVPAHWTSWKANRGFRIIGSGTTPKSDAENLYDGDVLWVTTSELRECVITDTAKKLTATALREYTALRVYPPGTLLLAMYGATIGRLGVLGASATVNQACVAFSEPEFLDTWFTFYWLQMRKPVLVAIASGGGQPNLSQDDLRQLRIPAPDVLEQRAIALVLDGETAEFDSLITEAQKGIDLLRERRSALISAAVTGQIDVRNAVPEFAA